MAPGNSSSKHPDFAEKGSRKTVNIFSKHIGIFCLLLSALLCAETIPADSAITAFPQKIAIQFLARYPYTSFVGKTLDGKALKTNRSVDIGIGGGYGDFTWSSVFAFSFGYDKEKPQSRATDHQLDYYGDRFFWRLYLKAIDGFFYDVESEEKKFEKADLLLVESGFNLNYLWNKEHSLRAAYSLDRRQWKSNGSFIWGVGLYYTGILSRDSLMPYFEDYQQFLYAGPDIGYSYTWIFENGWFLNLLGIASANWGMNLTKKSSLRFFQILPQFATGFHGDSWSIHFPMPVRILLFQTDDELSEINLFYASFGFMVTKRF